MLRWLIGLLLTLLLVATEAQAVFVQATWTARPASENPVTYKVYAGPGTQCGPGLSAVLGTVSHPTTTLTAEIVLAQPTTYRFCVTATDQAGNESIPSALVTLLLNPYWLDSFEDTGLPNWVQSPPGLNGTITVSSLQFVTGIRSLRFVFSDLTRVSGPTLQRTTPTGTELYTRFWMRATPGFTYGTPNTTLGVFGGGTTPPLVSLVTSTSVSGAPYFQIQTAKEASYGTETLFQNQGTPSVLGNNWVCYETRVRYNTPGVANGIIQFWAGGTLKADYQNREFLGTSTSDPAPSTATMSYVRLYNDRGSGELYMDDLQVSNARIGCDPNEEPEPNPTVIAPTNLRFATGGSLPSDIALDTTSQLTAAFATNTTTGSITVGSGTNRGLICAFQTRGVSPANRVVSTATLDAQSLTLIPNSRRAMSGVGGTVEWWGLLAPDSGGSTVTVTTTGVVSQLAGFCVALTGVNQTSMIGTTAGTVDETNTNTTMQTIVNNLTSGAWAFDALYTFNEYGLVVGSGQTQRDNRVLSGGGYVAAAGVSSVGPLAASVNQPMTWTYTPPGLDKLYAHSVITVVPSAGSGSTDVIQWNDNSDDETGFEGRWKHAGTGGAFVSLFSVGPNITEYPNPITTQTDACIEVRAVRGPDVSEWATALCQIPEPEPEPDPGEPIEPPPGQPDNPPVTPTPVPTTPSGKLTNGRSVVSWNTTNLSDPKRSTYIVEWTNYQRGANGWQAIGVTAPNATGFVHRYPPFVPAGEPRFWVCYRIKAVTPAGVSSYSPEECGDVDVFVPASPPSVQVPDGPSSVSLQ